MASFSDQISQFNPYIQEIPIQEMVQVGMAKQAQYDAGVQKIQSYVDSIAGLKVLRPADKEYLQSKLGQLGNNLKSVAAGDFSNQQLVNSVAGMASQIVKDPRIQNALSSTQRARTELDTAESLYRQGKSSIDNVNYLKNQVNQYASTTGADDMFTGRYINYVDLFKKFQTLADDIKKSAPDMQKDNPYKTDANGNTLYIQRDKKTGKVISASTDKNSGGIPELDDAMKRITIKGVSAQTMYDALANSLTSDDLAQMKVNAWAEYQGKGAQPIINDLTASTEIAKQVLKTGISKLTSQLTNPKLTTDEKTELQAQINKYNNKLTDGSFDKDLLDQVNALSDPKNLEAVQYNAYKKKLLNNQAVILSNQSYKEELLSNPYQMAAHQREVLQETIRQHNQTYKLSLAKFNEDVAQNAWARKWKQKEWDDAHPGIVTEDRAIPTNIAVPTTDSIGKDIDALNEQKTRLNNAYSKTLGKDVSSLNDLYQRYLTDPASVINNNEVKYVQARHIAEMDIKRKNDVRDLAHKAGEQFDKEIDDVIKGTKGIVKDNKELFSAKDLYETKQLVNSNFKVITTGGYGGVTNTESLLNEPAIYKAIGNNPQKLAIAKALIKHIKNESLTPTDRIIYDKSLELDKSLTGKLQSTYDKKFEAQSKIISKYDPQYQQQFGTIDKNNKGDMTRLDQLIGNTIDKLNAGDPIATEQGAKIDANTLSKMRAKDADGKMNVSATIVKNYDGSAIVHLQQGESVQTIPISATNFAKYYPEYAKTNSYSADFKATQANVYKTTNLANGAGDKNTDAVTAAHTGYEVPLLKGTPWANKVRYDIIADPNNDGDADNDRFAVRLFVNKNGKWIVGETEGGYVSAASVQNYIETQLGTNTIDIFLKKHK